MFLPLILHRVVRRMERVVEPTLWKLDPPHTPAYHEQVFHGGRGFGQLTFLAGAFSHSQLSAGVVNFRNRSEWAYISRSWKIVYWNIMVYESGRPIYSVITCYNGYNPERQK